MTKPHTSLSEINQSISIPKKSPFWKSLWLFSGPGALVAVGYMDPGNWITSVTGGAQLGYLLLAIVLLSSLMAMQLQQMAGKLGLVTGQDLAQIIAAKLPKSLRILFWIITELALMATDLAEVLGSAIALHLLFGWPLLLAIIVTIGDVFLLLGLMKIGFRKIEAVVATLILTILAVFTYLVILSKPDVSQIAQGFVLRPKDIGLGHPASPHALLLSLGIIGATVMPHNLYLHSAISQTRKVNHDEPDELTRAVRLMTWDSNIQLTLAFVVNSLLLILGASLFMGNADKIGSFASMYNALKDPMIAGNIASPLLSTLFAVALLASGQNATITGTLTGQIVMEGFLTFKLPQWAIRFLTRLIVLIPVILVALIWGTKEVVLDKLLIYSQVFLSLALPFSIFPLIYFSSQKTIMKQFANAKWNTLLAYLIAGFLSLLNLVLIIQIFNGI